MEQSSAAAGKSILCGRARSAHARRVQLDFFYDYRTNVELYPEWQAFLRNHQPKTIIFWSQDDIFFTREGGESYLSDLPRAQMHRLNSGRFAVEDSLAYIAQKMKAFYNGAQTERRVNAA